ncbi:hypothetical protein N3K66_004610 [Trichothecium roseum]|uniref:Uncharacterized protein n=1 Tax=Trichothecium roseum TaxID=47278 RepID=A0ACC0V3R2_9HYPO|nr:hypothetical protein N3K66_004610 [Trichothecium roseum]
MRRFSTAVTITDPLVKYQTLVASGLYAPDPAQHRLAHHLHKIYLRVKDYSPRLEYRERLKQVAKLTDKKAPDDDEESGILALRNHSIWRNPLFKHLLSTPEGRESLALTRTLANHETAIEIDSPKGLFLSGEVGTGKSMLLDLLADGLPTEKKKRWHFNTFMLYTLAQLESRRTSNIRVSGNESEYSLLWMAKKLVEESPILFLDEFQLPDRAASKILSHLFIAFFQLGGVLVASSNRMPDELQKAHGVDYSPAPPKGLVRRILGATTKPRGELFGSTSDFANFLDVLKARCDFWHVEGAQDWRRREEKDSAHVPSHQIAIGGASSEAEPSATTKKIPRHYSLISDNAQAWIDHIHAAVSVAPTDAIPWGPSSVVVYGRKVTTPQHYKGVVYWDFENLVETFGPADYITMASTYHTFVIDNVPILTIIKKNEARRFITLLDALYEARCKLFVRAENPPDDLFFPTNAASHMNNSTNLEEDDDATYSETIAEVYQDQTSPFRPNVSYYDTPSSTSQYNPDQDSDFGLQQKRQVDFSNTGAFTGEDERFAYKRATSRLWELCSAQWHSRTGEWWQPLPAEARHWENGSVSRPRPYIIEKGKVSAGEGLGDRVPVEEPAGLSKWRIADLKKQHE